MLRVLPTPIPTNLEGQLDEFNLVGSNSMQVISIQREVEQKIVGATINPAQFKQNKNIFTGNTTIKKTQDASLNFETATSTHFQIKAEDVITKKVYKIEATLDGRSSAILTENDVIKIYSTIGGIYSPGNFGDYLGSKNLIRIFRSEWTPFRIDEVEANQIIANEQIQNNKILGGAQAGGCSAALALVLGAILGSAIGGCGFGCFAMIALPIVAFFVVKNWWTNKYNDKINEFKETTLYPFLGDLSNSYKNNL